MVRARALILHAVALAATLTVADQASAAGTVGSSFVNGKYTAQISVVGAVQNDAPGLTVSGTGSGVVTFSAAEGLEVASQSGACVAQDPSIVICGTGEQPIDAVDVRATGAPGATVDLTRLAQRASLAGPYEPTNTPARSDASIETHDPFVTVTTGSGDDTVLGGPASAVYKLGTGDDTVVGGTGDEIVRAEAGATDDGDDTFDLGEGIDTVSYALRTAAIDAVLGTGVQTTGNGAAGENDAISNAEVLTGGTGDDDLSIVGRLGDRGTLFGNGGADTLTGGPGPDQLDGGYGSDTIAGNGGDDRLTGVGQYVTYAEHPVYGHDQLDGGQGDDELDIGGLAYPGAPRNADDTPICGPGKDVLRADADLDGGVGSKGGPDDCEFMSLVILGGANATGRLEVGETLTAQPPQGSGTPAAGRIGTTTWTICHPGASVCEGRVTPGATLTLLPDDLGAQIASFKVTLTEPLSSDPRWTAFRDSPAYYPPVAYGGPAEPGAVRAAGDHCPTVTYPGYPLDPSCVVTPTPTPAPLPTATPLPEPTPTTTPTPAATPTPMPVPAPVATPTPAAPPTATPTPTPVPAPAADAGAVASSVRSALGTTRPKLAALGRATSVAVTAPSGTTVRVAITVKRGKTTTLLSRGAAVTTRAGKIALVLKPTRAGRSTVKAGRALTVVISVTTTAPGGKPVTTAVRAKVRP